MGSWVLKKLQQWLVLIIGLAIIAGVMGIGPLFQSNLEPLQSVAVIPPVTQDGTAKPTVAPGEKATLEAKQTAAAVTGAKQGSEASTKADGKQSSGTKAEATAPVASGPQPVQKNASNPPAAPARPPAQTAQPAQTAAPMTHNHAPAQQLRP